MPRTGLDLVGHMVSAKMVQQGRSYRLNCVYPEDGEVLTPGTRKHDFIWKQGLWRSNQVEMTSLRWIPIQHDWCPYKGLDAWRKLCEGGGRNGGDMSTSRGTVKVASKLPEARRQAWNRFSLLPQKEPPCGHLALRLLASRTETNVVFEPFSLWFLVSADLGN